MKTKWMLAGLLLLFSVGAQAVVSVENTVAVQTPGTRLVTIGYDVSSDFSSVVSITLRAFDGETEITLANLSGDVGAGIATGAGRTIVWDAGADWYGGHSSGLQFVVLADDGEESTPMPVAGSVVIPAGTAVGTDPDSGAFSLELGNSIYADAYEVPKSEWDLVSDWAVLHGYDFLNEGIAVSNNHPVTAINWYDAVKWCNARSEMEGLTPCYTVSGSTYRSGESVPDWDPAANGYRLPSGDEWEYAARGGSQTRYPFGNQITHDDANYFSTDLIAYDVSLTRGFHPDYGPAWPRTSPVASFAPNAFGLYDTVGNVWEWCWDEVLADGSRLQRGGDWFADASQVRSGSEFLQFPDASSIYCGFRTVRNAGSSIAGTASAMVDARDYILSVISTAGAPSPSAGVHAYAWGSTVSCSVGTLVVESNTVYIGKGWIGSGSVPASGSSNNTGVITLTDLTSTIVWKWVADNDIDGLPNDWELAYYGSVTGALASADTDGDGYSGLQELLLGTDPTNALSQLGLTISATTNGTPLLSFNTVSGNTYTIEYTDSLSEPDWQELAVTDGTGGLVMYEDSGYDPNRSYRLVVESGYNETLIWRQRTDSDGDQLPDDWEAAYFASAQAALASLDSDLDGYSNLEEFWLGTDPTNNLSNLNFTIGASSGGAAAVSCQTAPGRVYYIEYTDSLASPDWRWLGGFIGTGARMQFEDSAAMGNRYYRMRVELPAGVEP